MTETTDQAEFIFSSEFRRPRGVAPTHSPQPSASGPRSRRRPGPPPLPRTPRRRRGVAPSSRRLAISREAFRQSDDDAGQGGLVEAGVAILATMAFGFGWAAYELGFDAFSSKFSAGGAQATEYALVVPPSPLGVAGVEGAEWTRKTTDRYAREFMPTADSSAR